jgi:hypothetical protein
VSSPLANGPISSAIGAICGRGLLNALEEGCLITLTNLPDAFMDAAELWASTKADRHMSRTEWLMCCILAAVDYKPNVKHRPEQYERWWDPKTGAGKTKLESAARGMAFSVQNFGGDWTQEYIEFLMFKAGIKKREDLGDSEETRRLFKVGGVQAVYEELMLRDVPSMAPEVGSW